MQQFWLQMGLCLAGTIGLFIYFKHQPEPKKKFWIERFGGAYIAPEERTRIRFLRNLVDGRKQFRRELPFMILGMASGLIMVILEVLK